MECATGTGVTGSRRFAVPRVWDGHGKEHRTSYTSETAVRSRLRVARAGTGCVLVRCRVFATSPKPDGGVPLPMEAAPRRRAR